MGFIENFVEYLDNAETCDMYKKWCAVSAICASLQRRVKIQLGHIEIYPNMYIALVGSAGKTRKGTAIGPYRKLLESAGITICSESISTAKLVNRLKNATETYQESVGAGREPVVYSHSSLTLIAPELSVFIGYQERKFLATLADWWDSNDTWTYETISRGTDEIQGVWFNFLGGITPELLQTALPQDAVGGGLLSRMILVYSETRGPTQVFPETTPKQLKLKDELLTQIDQMALMRGEFVWSETAKELYKAWRLESVANPPFNDYKLIGYNERRAVHLLKLMMVMNASRGGDMLISGDDFDKASDLLSATEMGMPRALRGVGARDDSAVIAKIMTVLETRKFITESQLHQVMLYDASKQLIEEVIDTLIKAKALKMEKKGGSWVYIWIQDDQNRSL